jgi:hypothetical protein
LPTIGIREKGKGKREKGKGKREKGKGKREKARGKRQEVKRISFLVGLKIEDAPQKTKASANVKILNIA